MAPDTAPANDPRKPRDDEIDVWGLTHVGKVRKINQDHFLLASIHKRVSIHSTSLSDEQLLPFGDERAAYIALLADGVGGGEGGEKASATALAIATQYVVSSMNVYYASDATAAAFADALEAAALRCNDAVVERAKAEGARSMATTLTLWLGVWPWYYVLQVGDSRYYLYRQGRLTQVSRDQTLAQDLVDQGVFSRSAGERSQFAHVLSRHVLRHALERGAIHEGVGELAIAVAGADLIYVALHVLLEVETCQPSGCTDARCDQATE